MANCTSESVNNNDEYSIGNDHPPTFNHTSTIISLENNASDSVTVCFFNARSIVNKLSQFQSFVLSSNIDIICVTETWLTNGIFDQEILPHNYCVHRNDRKSRGGGVLIATKSSINASLISKSDHLEVISLHLHLQLLLCCTYVPPNSSVSHVNDLVSYISDLTSLHGTNDIILVGDFNMPDIDWGSLSATSQSSALFCDFVFNNNLSQLIDKPTHNKGNILDLLLTYACHRIQDINITSPHNSNVFNTDHSTVTFTLTHSVTPHPKVTPSYVFDFSKADYTGLCSFLMDINFNPLLSSNDVNFVWSSLKTIIYSGMDIYLP